MVMTKFYFNEHDREHAYELDHHYQFMEDEGLTEMKVFEANRETGNEFFFCKHFRKVGVRGNCQGCEAYQPRNGKSGICRHWDYTYEKSDNKKVLKL